MHKINSCAELIVKDFYDDAENYYFYRVWKSSLQQQKIYEIMRWQKKNDLFNPKMSCEQRYIKNIKRNFYLKKILLLKESLVISKE